MARVPTFIAFLHYSQHRSASLLACCSFCFLFLPYCSILAAPLVIANPRALFHVSQARYIGSLVGDFHRTILYGGIYGYPPDAKNANGKLRLIYECAPMSMIAEQVRNQLRSKASEQTTVRCSRYSTVTQPAKLVDLTRLSASHVVGLSKPTCGVVDQGA